MAEKPQRPPGRPPGGAVERQIEIYRDGMEGRRPGLALLADELERRAREVMSDEAFAYVAGGAGGESTMRANRDSLDRWRIVPRVLRDLQSTSHEIELFGRRLPAPLLLGPIGVLELAHERADLAVAEAAAALGLPLVFSNQASRSMESCAAVMGDAPRWFQLYWSKSDELNASFVRRAEAAGCGAVVVTLDTQLLGWRVRDLERGFLPFLHGQGIAQYVSDPVFRSWLSKAPEEDPRQAVQKFLSVYSKPSLSWEELAELRQRTELPIVLKGINHPDDAKSAVDWGFDGIIVSNHGGRQLDGAIGAFDALPKVLDVAAARMPVLFDSGVRGGADMFKALAMGATAVCLGRPYVYALALAGRAGVEEAVRNLLAEFAITMGVAGCARLDDLDRGYLSRLPEEPVPE